MEDISFDAPEVKVKEIVVDKAYVQKQLQEIIKDQDLRRFIL
jgi:ATP-dependent HslUV protease ATP-binding subunit HslU